MPSTSEAGSPVGTGSGERCSCFHNSPDFTSPTGWVMLLILRSYPSAHFSYRLSSRLVLLQIHQPAGGTVRLKTLTDQLRPAAAGAALGDGVGEILYSMNRRQENSSYKEQNIIPVEEITPLIGFVLLCDQPPVQEHLMPLCLSNIYHTQVEAP